METRGSWDSRFRERPFFKALKWKVMEKDALHVCIGVCTSTYMCIYKINGNKTEKFCFKTEHRAFSLGLNYLEGVLISIT